jgi:uncharacterized protein (DUF1778 family)
MLKRAAEIQGRTLTDFVVSAVQEAAQRTIEQGEVVRLSLADSERFAQVLLSPAGPVASPGARLRTSPQAAECRMIDRPLRVIPLAAAHDRTTFDSGSEPLDR